MDNELLCWAKIARPSALFDFFLYFDVGDESLADRMISEVNLRFPVQKKVLENSKYKYRMVICRVLKIDSERFISALDKLPDMMLLCGHTDYVSFCHSQLSNMKETMQKQI